MRSRASEPPLPICAKRYESDTLRPTLSTPRPYCFGETRAFTLALLTFTALSGWCCCGVVITKFSGHAVTPRSSPTVVALLTVDDALAQAAFPPPPPKVSSAAGVIDMHVHSHPDVFGRSMDDIDVAQLAKSRGMRGIVLKNHISETETKGRPRRWYRL